MVKRSILLLGILQIAPTEGQTLKRRGSPFSEPITQQERLFIAAFFCALTLCTLAELHCKRII